MTELRLPPSEATRRNPIIIPPEGGWEQKSWYLVECSVSLNNHVFEGLLYTGFLNDYNKQPGSYSCIVARNGCDGCCEIREFIYIKALKQLLPEEN